MRAARRSTLPRNPGSRARGHHRAFALQLMIAAACSAAACKLDVLPRAHRGSPALDGSDSGTAGTAGSSPSSPDLPDAAMKPDVQAPAMKDSGPEGPVLEQPDGTDADAGVETDSGPDAAPGDTTVPDPPSCVDGDTRSAACGLNGRGEQNEFCMDGELVPAACSDPDTCIDEVARDVACGANGNGTLAQRCVAGQWQDEGACDDADECMNDATRHVACGLNGNGALAQRCMAGQWHDEGVCGDLDVCANGGMRAVTCGPNGNGTRPQRCSGGQWQNDGACVDQDVCMNGTSRAVACGVRGGGTRAQRCASGQWQDYGECNDPDWTCDVAFYDMREGCDCGCGSRDPDCDVADQPLFNCAEGEFCNAQGACAEVPSAWLCEPSYYATRDGCDCECGIRDPDCAVADQEIYGCATGEVCSAAGHCTD